jgi:hypothetical protein
MAKRIDRERENFKQRHPEILLFRISMAQERKMPNNPDKPERQNVLIGREKISSNVILKFFYSGSHQEMLNET